MQKQNFLDGKRILVVDDEPDETEQNYFAGRGAVPQNRMATDAPHICGIRTFSTRSSTTHGFKRNPSF